MQIPRPILQSLEIRNAASSEANYDPPYLPATLLKTVIDAHLDDAARQLTARYQGGFDVPAAEVLQVPKRRGGFRQVSILDFSSRVLYRALEDKLAPSLAEVDRSWEAKQAFERAPLEVDARYVVIADVAAFYDFVDHAMLEDELVGQTGDADVVELAIGFLRNVMGRQFGLPQVLHASDVFSEAYIDVAERHLLRSGLAVWRHNDDFRIAASTWREANTAFEALDRVVRDLGLALNEHKCFVLTAERYAAWLAEPEIRWVGINEQVELDLRSLSGYAEEGEEEVEITAPAVLEAAAKQALELALDDSDVADRLQEEVNRQLIGVSIRALRRIPSQAALPRIAEVLNREPQLTAEISRYLAECARLDEASVAAICVDLVRSSRVHVSAWQALWLVETVRALQELPEDLRVWLDELVSNSSPDVLRARAALALAEAQAIDLDVVTELYGTVTPSSRPDVVTAAATATDQSNKRLDAIARDDPLNRWIIDAARAE